MKRYYNSTTHEWYTEGQSMTRRVDNGVFSGIPSEEQLTAWGFEEYIEPEPTPAELLERAKMSKIAEIEAYDNSDNVNEFTFGDVKMWLNDATRTKLAKRFDTDEADGLEVTKITYENVAYELPIAIARTMLHRLESYARDCFDKTNEHKMNVMNLDSVEEINNYNYTQGYPTKLTFNLE